MSTYGTGPAGLVESDGAGLVKAERPYKVPIAAHEGRPVPIMPRTLDEVARFAKMVVSAKMAPKDFDTEAKCSVAICHGLEIGLSPLQALQRIAVINGRPCLWGEAVPALALSTGLVEDWIERIDGEGDQMVATCRVKRKGLRSYIEATFSVADAKRANLWGKAGPWTQYPKRMLQMRARRAFRDGFADALGGLYIAEELIGDEMKDVTPVATLPPVTAPPQGGKPELPPLAPAADTVSQPTATPPLEGEVMPPQPKNGKGKKPLPPVAQTAQRGTPPVLPAAEAEVEVNRIIDLLDMCESEASLHAWATTHMPLKKLLPVEQWKRLEQTFNLKQALVQKMEKQ